MSLLENPLFLLLLAIVLGQLIGKIEYKNFKLGSSGTLFAGLFLSYLSYQYIGNSANTSEVSVTISKQLFSIALIGFIASVGLLAAKDIKKTLKENGFKFLILGFTITFTGALSTYLIAKYMLPHVGPSIIGTYVGALTSSPGLATALESGALFGVDGEALIGLGYSIAYIPGVLMVILYVQFQGRAMRREASKQPSLRDLVEDSFITSEHSFSVISFAFIAVCGILLGSLKVNLGEAVGNFSLGKTGGVLISALFFGHLKQFIGLNFNFDPKVLKGIRDISLNLFLATVGINYGAQMISVGGSAGSELLIVGFITGTLSILVGYIVGRKVLKIERVPLVGGLCGGMTSTPGLASAIESMESDEVTVYYGATYPFALLFMILFTNIIAQLLV